MGFDAAKVAEPLDWDFTSMPGATPADKGVIPEPSLDEVDLFGQRYRSLLNELHAAMIQDEKAVPGESTDEAAKRLLTEAQKPLMQRLEEWSQRTAEGKEEGKRVNQEMRRILADVCGGSPTLAQIELLPSRHLRFFLGWVNEELTAPKLRDGAFDSKPSPDPSQSAASGTS